MVLQLLEAAKAGDVEMVYRLIVTCQNQVSVPCATDSAAATVSASKAFRPPSDLINCRDIDGRHSTPLHFAAGYNRLGVVELLLQFGADVHAKDKGGLVPLHNACSYGHAKDTDSLVYDILRGDIAVLEAAKRGNLSKIQRLIIPENINCRDTQGRNSTPLHLAAGYNNIEVVEFLLDMGADANAQDKGGLIPLHNASSYGHIDVAALLIRHGTSVNAVDKWGYTPLHEAAQKGRTQLCSLLLAHGANPNARNEEGQTPYDLATADDVKSLLADAMPLPALPTLSDSLSVNGIGSNSAAFVAFPSAVHVGPRIEGQGQETPDASAIVNAAHPIASTSVTQPTLTTASFLTSIGLDHLVELFDKEQVTLDILAELGHEELKELGVTVYGQRHKIIKGVARFRSVLLPSPATNGVTGVFPLSTRPATVTNATVPAPPQAPPGGGPLSAHFASPGGTHFRGVGVAEAAPPGPDFFPVAANNETVLINLPPGDPEFQAVEEQLQSSIREHKDTCGGVFERFHVLEISRIRNRRLWDRYLHRCAEIAEDCAGHCNERFLFHGSPFLHSIVTKGFDERHAYIGGMFGAGIYFAENSSKSNQYIYGIGGGSGCPNHKSRSCYVCPRQMLLCRVALGRSFIQFNAMKVAHAPPGHHSVVGRPSAGGLNFAEYVVYRGEQAYPEYRITYLLVPPDPTTNTTSAGDSTSAPPPLTSSVSRPNAAPAQTSNLLPSAAFSCPTAGSSTTNVSVNARGGAPSYCSRPAPGGPGGNP
nr:unnamed protein product [Spirometra erinaceieuropaei]